MNLVKIPAYQQKSKTDDELKRLKQMEAVGIDPEPETEEEKRAKWTKTHFWINPEAVSLCLPGEIHPESETAVWMLDGEAFLACAPIDKVVGILTKTIQSEVEQWSEQAITVTD